MARSFAAACLLAVFLPAACSVQRLALEGSRGTLRAMEASFRSETSVRFAREAGPGLLKSLEGMAATAPEDLEIQAMACRLHAQYALAFLLEEDPGYAGRLLELAAGYGEAALAAAGPGKRPPEVLFWLAAARTGQAAVAGGEVDRLRHARAAQSLLEEVLAAAPDIEHGMAWLLRARLRAGLPVWLGGGTEAALEDVAAAWERSGRRLLLARVERARLLLARGGEAEALEARQVLAEVLAAPKDILPGDELLTAVAREEARRLREAPGAD